MGESTNGEQGERCETCRWWERCDAGGLYETESKSGAHLSENHDGLDVGKCRRFPPAVSDLQASMMIGQGIYPGPYFTMPLGVLCGASVHPHTCEWDFCGEYQAKRVPLPVVDATNLSLRDVLSGAAVAAKDAAKESRLGGALLPSHGWTYTVDRERLIPDIGVAGVAGVARINLELRQSGSPATAVPPGIRFGPVYPTAAPRSRQLGTLRCLAILSEVAHDTTSNATTYSAVASRVNDGVFEPLT